MLAALTDVVGPRNAHFMSLTGAMVSPNKALELGFIDEVVSPDELLPRSKQVEGFVPS